MKILPPDEEQTIRILEGLRLKYEEYHGVRYSTEGLRHAVLLSNRYITDRFLPDKAIDVIDEAGAKAKILAQAARAAEPGGGIELPLVDRARVEEVVALWTGVPVTAIREDEREKFLRLEDVLHRRVIGQDKAISALARAIRRSRAGIKNPCRPIGSFIFLGPTGVGKTEAAKALSEFLFGDERALIRLDMSEYMERHSVAKMIGSPPGYVGYEEGGQLVERVKRRPYSVILFDEVEKAHPDVLNMLLQVLEDGHLTDSYGETVDFKNTLLILTSNLGSKFILDRDPLGFGEGGDHNAVLRKDEVIRHLKQALLPEFLNRLDEIVVFDALGRQELLAVAARMIQDLNRTLETHGLRLMPAPGVVEFLVDACCTDPAYGARPLRRGVQRHIEDPLAEWMLLNEAHEGSEITLEVRGDRLELMQPLLAPISG
ncbi:MAG: hypothetical protein B7X11_00910 [Acidobacteria bacterium 37-65-4]|nr:MAG: hypothetical protein B7X11_00910 [Acidobacteria bacterium 37-65-4]